MVISRWGEIFCCNGTIKSIIMRVKIYTIEVFVTINNDFIFEILSPDKYVEMGKVVPGQNFFFWSGRNRTGTGPKFFLTGTGTKICFWTGPGPRLKAFSRGDRGQKWLVPLLSINMTNIRVSSLQKTTLSYSYYFLDW
jgi:hypothetical protein